MIRYLYNYNELHQTRIISERGDDIMDIHLNDVTHIKWFKPERKIKMENNDLYASMSYEIDRLKQEVERLHIERGDYGFLGNPSCRGIYAMDLDVNAMKDNLTATEFDILRNFNIGMPKALILAGINAINKLINLGVINDPVYNGPFFPRQGNANTIPEPYKNVREPNAPKTRNPYVSRPHGNNPWNDNDLIDKLLNPSTNVPYNGEVIELKFKDEKIVDEIHEQLQGMIDYVDNTIVLDRENKTMTVCVGSLIKPLDVTPIITKIIEDMIVRGNVALSLYTRWNSEKDGSTTDCELKKANISDTISEGCEFDLNGSITNAAAGEEDTTETETKTEK